MSNAHILEEVASRKITPEQGVEKMLEEDRSRRMNARPAWAPPWLWVVTLALFAFVLSACGIRRD